MAKLESCTRSELVEVKKTVHVLTLSTEEVEALADILAKVCGDPTCSRRKITDGIFAVIRKFWPETGMKRSDISGSILFL